MSTNSTKHTGSPTPQNIASPYGWPPGGTWIARVTYVHPIDNWGLLTVYDDDGRELHDPAGRPVTDAWFRNKVALSDGDWIMLEVERAPRRELEDRDNPYLLRAADRSIKRVRDITKLTQQLQADKQAVLNNLRDNYLEDLILLGERIFIVDSFARDIEARIAAKHEQQYAEKRSNLEQEYAGKQAELERVNSDLERERNKQHEDQKKIAAQREELEKGVATFEDERQQFQSQMQQELAQIQQRGEELAAIEAQHQERLRRWGLLIEQRPGDEQQYATFSSERELIDRVQDYIAARNYSYQRQDLVNFYTCLKTGAIIILAGLSGTGKSSLVRLFAEAIDAEFRLVPVKPTWNDDTDLLGFFHPDKRRYYSTPFLDTIVEANANPGRLFFICLDEMNLARVEYYLSNFLSVLEQGRERKLSLYSRYEWEMCKLDLEQQRRALADGTMSQKEWEHRQRSVEAYSADLRIPHNVFFCGTVNIDETIHPFSDKVLDRSQIIQLNDLRFRDLTESAQAVLPVQLRFPQFEAFSQVSDGFRLGSDWFNEINTHLRVGGFHFGHRVKRHIDQYCSLAHSSGLFDGMNDDSIADLQIVQKILPKVRGIKTESVARMLSELQIFCSSRYPEASRKLDMMQSMDPINYWQVFHD